MMRNALVLLLCAATGSACTTLRPVGVSTDEAQRLIAAGELLKPGDKVRLFTADGKAHEFEITAIDAADGTVKGATDSVRVAEIVTVANRELSVGKTLGLVFGIVGGLQLGAALGSIATLGP